MQKLNKDGSVEINDWRFVDTDSEGITAAELGEGMWVLPLSLVKQLAEDINFENCGLWLASDDDVNELKPYIDQLKFVVCRFAAFMDGRGFSQARMLRDNLDYQGELTAEGAFIQDQLFFLQRCGFSSFLIEDDDNVESMRSSLNDSSDCYQAACDEPRPLFRRRA